jgi:hypothetical protein
MFKKIITFFMALLMAVQPLVASATDLDAAFGNLLGPGAAASVNKPGNYQSGARNSFVAGGLEMRVPRASSTAQLFSVTPPKVTAGCNGISATFGGFSFISGAEFEQSLKSIASGAALGFVSMMVMKTMCPPCEAVVQFLKTAAQQAARLSKDSCQWGQELAQKFMAGSASQGDPVPVCGTTISGSGGTKDFLSAMNSACDSVKSAIDTIVDANPEAKTNPDVKGALQCAVGVGMGNMTWQRLAAFDSEGVGGSATSCDTDGCRRKLLLLNLLGAELGYDGSNKVSCATKGLEEKSPEPANPDAKDSVAKPIYCEPKLNAQDAIGLFMCGEPGAASMPIGSSSPRVAEYCQSFFTGTTSSAATGGSLSHLKSMEVYTCLDGPANCQVLGLGTSAAILGGQGFLVSVNNLLRKGVDAVRTNKKMPTDVIALMQVAPYPLYQAINAAAVYPAAADDLVDSMSILVAEQAAVAYLDDALRLQGRATAKAKGCVTPQQASKILEMVGAMRAASKARRQEIGQNIAIQEALTEQIRQINMTIQKQVMTQDMLSSGQYAQGLNTALAPNVSQSNPLTALPAITPSAPTTPSP